MQDQFMPMFPNNSELNPSPGIEQHQIRATQEKLLHCKKGFCMLFINIILLCAGIGCAVCAAMVNELIPVPVVCFIISFFMFTGYFTIEPNEAVVMTFFGKYVGTVKDSGFFWINPFTSKQKISLRANNLNGEVIKVNDKVGNPIMVGCVVVWRVHDTAKACFDVQNYHNYVSVQSESAVRFIGCKYPYEKVNEGDITLRSGHDEIHKALQQELSERLSKAGIFVEEARITELAYASEIANVMLKRQAAEAIIAAREKIVQGAVSIVGHALNSLQQNNICDLKPEERSRLVSNMLVVLCSETQVSPVVNTGSAS